MLPAGRWKSDVNTTLPPTKLEVCPRCRMPPPGRPGGNIVTADNSTADTGRFAALQYSVAGS
jgi:hypothetical protein